MSNKEAFKMSLANQVIHDKETILPLLIEPNPQKWSGPYFSNIYRKVSRYVCTEHELDIVFYCEYINEFNVNVQLIFEEFKDKSRSIDELSSIDVSSRNFMPRPFFQEYLKFKDNKMIITIKYFDMEFGKGNKFVKADEDFLHECTYNFENKTFSGISAGKMMRYILDYRGDSSGHIYVDAVLTNTIEQEFLKEVSRDYLKGSDYTKFKKMLFGLDPTNKGGSTMFQLLGFLSSPV